MLEVYSDNGIFQIDSINPNLIFKAKHTFTWTNNELTNRTIDITNYQFPVYCHSGNKPIALYEVFSNNVRTLNVVVNNRLGMTGQVSYHSGNREATVYIFDYMGTTSTDNFGLEVYNAQANLIFSSSFVPFRMIGQGAVLISNLTLRNNTNSGNFDATKFVGKKLANFATPFPMFFHTYRLSGVTGFLGDNVFYYTNVDSSNNFYLEYEGRYYPGPGQTSKNSITPLNPGFLVNVVDVTSL